MPDRIALVTGASRGLGAAMALHLARGGWQVVAVARTVGGLEEVDDRAKAADAPGALTLAPMDITVDEAMRHLCLSVHERWGRIDLWAHAADPRPAAVAPAAHLDAADWDKALAVNLRATGVLIPMVEGLLRASPAGAALFFDDLARGREVLRGLRGHQGRADRPRPFLGGGDGAPRAPGRSPEPAPHGDGDARALLPGRGSHGARRPCRGGYPSAGGVCLSVGARFSGAQAHVPHGS